MNIHKNISRPLLARHPAAARRQGAARRPALRRNGSVGARSLRGGAYPAGNAHGEERRRDRPHPHLRVDRPRTGHPGTRPSRILQRPAQGTAVAGPRRADGETFRKSE